MSDTPGGVRRPAPRVGEHTAEVLAERLAMRSEEITDLQHRGVVGGRTQSSVDGSRSRPTLVGLQPETTDRD